MSSTVHMRITELKCKIEEFEKEYIIKYKEYRNMGDSLGWRGRRASLDALEDNIKYCKYELKQLGFNYQSQCFICHN
jgi:exopolysaccharide biosynthesis predicted pyruvyltransferase EpsI